MRKTVGKSFHFFPSSLPILSTEDLISRKAAGPRRLYFISKRAFDILVSLFFIPVLLGICVVLMVLNPFWNAGPLLFFQERSGKDGRKFRIFKFRSMSCEGQGARCADDPLEKSRITPLGHFLREYKIDELPQIVNVLFGHMSIVGPRPEISSFVSDYKASIAGYELRETLQPGITGYAQVVQGYTNSIEEVRRKTELDLFYIRNAGWKLDLQLIFATIWVVLAPNQARAPDGRPAIRQEGRGENNGV